MRDHDLDKQIEEFNAKVYRMLLTIVISILTSLITILIYTG